MSDLSLIPSFNSGELSPLIHLRSDLEKYHSGCRTLENFHITPYGGVKRRAGFAYYGTANDRCRLFRFQESTSLGYIMEFGANYIRWYLNGIVRDDAGEPYTLATPYSADDLAKLQMAQINSVAYFTHPDFPPHKLRRIHNAEWKFDPVDFTYPAMLEENLDKTITLNTGAGGAANTDIAVTASQPIFTPGHEGAYFQISHERQLVQFETVVGAVDHDVAPQYYVIVQGAWNLTTFGTWTGTFTLERSTDGSAWTAIRQFVSTKGDRNFSAGGEEASRVYMRLRWNYGNVAGNHNPRCVLEATGPYLRGLVKIKKVYNATQALATVMETVEGGTTSYWREGAWSAARGYPRTVTAHEQRICYGGTAARPSTVWASRVDDYENFTPGGTKDDDSWTHSMASDQQNSIQWMISQKSLLIGTSGDEWVLSSSKQGSIITPTNVQARRHSGHGSEFLKARVINDSVLFVQRGGRKVRDMSYDFRADGYVSSDLMLLAEHIAEDGIVDTAYQTHPLPVLWCVTKGGNLLSLTYDKARDNPGDNKLQGIVGWARHTTGKNADGFESVAVRSISGQNDQVWVVVRRHIADKDPRYIERLCSDGFFLEEPWSELYAPTYGTPPWHTTSTHFNYGDVVQDTNYFATYGTVAFCSVAHDADASDTLENLTDQTQYPTHLFPAANGKKWNPVRAWSTLFNTDGSSKLGASIELNELYYKDGYIYRCIVDKTFPMYPPPDLASTPREDWKWQDLGPMPTGTPPVWSAGSSYANGTYVSWNGRKYQAKTTIPAIPSQEPQPAPALWEARHGMYAADDLVSADGVTYICEQDHTPSSDNRPGSGTDWTTYWTAQTTIWQVIQGTYAIGDLVSANGRNYICTRAHTPAPLYRPGTGNEWPAYWTERPSENLLFYVDSGVSKFGEEITALTGFTGLDHLEGETVQILADGAVLEPRVVTGGAILFDQPDDPEMPAKFASISVGLPYDSILEPMALEMGLPNGTSVSRERRIHDLVIYFHKTNCGKVSDSVAGPYDTLSFRTVEMMPDDPVPLFTGAYFHKLESRHGRDASFVIKQDEPLPMEVLAVIPKWNIHGE